MREVLLPQCFAAIFDVALDVQPKGYEKIKNDGGAECYKGDVDKVHADTTGCNAHFFTQIAANTEGRTFEYVLELFHFTNVKICSGFPRKG